MRCSKLLLRAEIRDENVREFQALDILGTTWRKARIENTSQSALLCLSSSSAQDSQLWQRHRTFLRCMKLVDEAALLIGTTDNDINSRFIGKEKYIIMEALLHALRLD